MPKSAVGTRGLYSAGGFRYTVKTTELNGGHMPKIDVNEKLFFSLLGEKYSYDVLEQRLTCAKAELDEKPDPKAPENERTAPTCGLPPALPANCGCIKIKMPNRVGKAVMFYTKTFCRRRVKAGITARAS